MGRKKSARLHNDTCAQPCVIQADRIVTRNLAEIGMFCDQTLDAMERGCWDDVHRYMAIVNGLAAESSAIVALAVDQCPRRADVTKREK